MKKILIIRFSSIGDIVLTTPLIRCVKNQTNTELHYLTKHKYALILESNPYVDKVITFDTNFSETLKKLHSEDYHIVIDLHKNLRSFLIKSYLKCPSYSVKKENFKKILFIYFGLNLLRTHTVDRYFDTIQKLNIINDNTGLDYFVPQDTCVEFNVKQNYIAWCIGASYTQKALSKEQIINTCNQLPLRVVLLGGANEKEKGKYIMQKSSNSNIDNFCGNLSLHQSAYLLKHSALVLTNDTGLMHIASSLKKPIISFWGCTKPSLGFSPYMNKNHDIRIVSRPKKRPCSKHGNFCRVQQQGCIKQIDYNVIIRELESFFDLFISQDPGT